MRKIFFTLAVVLFTSSLLCGQINLKDKLKKKSEDKAEEQIDESIDKGFDTVEGLFKKDKQKEEDSKTSSENSQSVNADAEEKKADVTEVQTSAPLLSWSKYDFIPGDKILFEDNQEDEENGEFPSRWDLVKGRVENANFDNANVIYFMTASSTIIPYIDNRNQDYVPDKFTLEFDAYYEKEEYTAYQVWFSDIKNQNPDSKLTYPVVIINASHAKTKNSSGVYPGAENDKYNNSKGMWRHVSISFNRRALKVYIDDARVLNVPNMEINPTGITLGIDGFGTAGVKGINRYIKNIRLAEGAVKLYDKLQQEGKIVSNGIRFDVNKATIKPESMGVLNKVYDLMVKHPEIKFRIYGHTDSDGDETYNQQLSEQRAAAVADKLVSMGIEKGRLMHKGFGETVPVSGNSTPEGKAQNRRVEFVKL